MNFFCFVGIEMVYQIIETRNVLNQLPFYTRRFAMVYPLTARKGHLGTSEWIWGLSQSLIYDLYGFILLLRGLGALNHMNYE